VAGPCGGACACRSSATVEVERSLVVHTTAAHTLATVSELAEHHDARVTADGRSRIVTCVSPRTFVLELDAALTATERSEMRVALLPDRVDAADGGRVLDAAMGALTVGALAARLRTEHLAALVDDQRNFHALFQPIVALDSGEVVAHEALLRATDERGAEVGAPALFGAAAAGNWTHVLDRIGRETAIRDASPWLGDGALFINFVPTSIYRPELCLASTQRAAATYDVPFSQLVFEVVETHRTEDPDHLLTIVEHYRERGARVALDDVGAGYSSLTLVARIRPDIVKVDRELIQGLPDDDVATSIVRAITELAHDIGADVIAEGVETEAQADAALQLGIELGQGWHFGRPAPAGTTAETRHEPLPA
jgi:EAL domain-containing protein (putative c-di-GMP-specific phosphodiesterase class I)